MKVMLLYKTNINFWKNKYILFNDIYMYIYYNKLFHSSEWKNAWIKFTVNYLRNDIKNKIDYEFILWKIMKESHILIF